MTFAVVLYILANFSRISVLGTVAFPEWGHRWPFVFAEVVIGREFPDSYCVVRGGGWSSRSQGGKSFLSFLIFSFKLNSSLCGHRNLDSIAPVSFSNCWVLRELEQVDWIQWNRFCILSPACTSFMIFSVAAPSWFFILGVWGDQSQSTGLWVKGVPVSPDHSGGAVCGTVTHSKKGCYSCSQLFR